MMKFKIMFFLVHSIIIFFNLDLTAYELLGNSYEEKNLKFISYFLKNAKVCYSNREVLDVALNNNLIDGVYLEMGVFTGSSINYIAHKIQDHLIYGFDSFEGLPEAWTRDDTILYSQGFFAVSQLPDVASNVILYKGWFDKTLPQFKSEVLGDKLITFIHIDCDIYSSTKTVFDLLFDHLVEGTVLVFDELYNYAGFDQHELKAFFEFLDQKNLSAEYLAYNIHHEQVAVRLVKP